MWDHPRACGEQMFEFLADARYSGSSPRVRGAGDTKAPKPGKIGIIPACAGSSTPPRHRLASGWDHPRVCGEQYPFSCARLKFSGSSPRVRGAGLGLGFVAICFGIIPACAGSRICNQPLIYQLRDNPRVCGEQVLTTLRYVATEGSSPRVRGAGPPL